MFLVSVFHLTDHSGVLFFFLTKLDRSTLANVTQELSLGAVGIHVFFFRVDILELRGSDLGISD